MSDDLETKFSKGLLPRELFLGVVVSVSSRSVEVNFSRVGSSAATHYFGGRYGRGEVGEEVLIESQQNLILGRINQVRLQHREFEKANSESLSELGLDAVGYVQLLGTVAMDNLSVSAGVDTYPRVGDRIYSAMHDFVGYLPELMDRTTGSGKAGIRLDLGSVGGTQSRPVSVRPERLFGRHCAILGATGGGKSWSTAHLIGECRKFQSKVILIDPTGEYRGFSGEDVYHCHLGKPVAIAEESVDAGLPPNSFSESDFSALFQPAGKVQGPRLRAAIRSLRLANIRPDLATNGIIKKINQRKVEIEEAERDPQVASRLDNPREKFDPEKLVSQIEQECVYPEGFGAGRGEKDPTKWGGEDGNFSFCLSLVARINGVLSSRAFEPVFDSEDKESLTDIIDRFSKDSRKLLRVCLSGVDAEFGAREIIANTIGRHLLELGRSGQFHESPTLLVVDEAHNFIGRTIGSEEFAERLDSFELIAREGRKYGLNISLASQRPRDLTESVLSQMGTLVVHRLTNDRDRDIVERACGEIDKDVSSFLPNLRPGEAAFIGVDFPIPLTLKIGWPETEPVSDGPNYQDKWKTSE